MISLHPLSFNLYFCFILELQRVLFFYFLIIINIGNINDENVAFSSFLANFCQFSISARAINAFSHGVFQKPSNDLYVCTAF